MNDDDKTKPDKLTTYHPLEHLQKYADDMQVTADRHGANELLSVNQLLVVARSFEGMQSLVLQMAAKYDLVERDLRDHKMQHAEAYRALVNEMENVRRRGIVFEADVRAALSGILEAVAEVKERERHMSESLGDVTQD